MADNRTRLTHPDKPGVVARMAGDDIIAAHIADGWELEEVQKVVPEKVIESAPKKRRTRKPRK